MSKNLEDFLATYNGNDEHKLITIDIPATDGEKDPSPFILVRCGDKAVVINPQGFSDHLCVDLHSFVDGEDATAGVFGMGQGLKGRAQFGTTGTTSHGWNSTPLVIVLVGEQKQVEVES